RRRGSSARARDGGRDLAVGAPAAHPAQERFTGKCRRVGETGAGGDTGSGIGLSRPQIERGCHTEGTRHLKLIKGSINARAQKKPPENGPGALPPGAAASSAAAVEVDPESAARPVHHRSRVICLFFRQAGDWKVPLREIAEACIRFTPKVAIREG